MKILMAEWSFKELAQLEFVSTLLKFIQAVEPYKTKWVFIQAFGGWSEI